MKKQLKAVEEFHKAFNAPVADKPKLIGKERGLLKWDLMDEENTEYLEAINEENLVEVADALGDMLYILCGTIIEHGMQHKIEEVFDEIHRSNMSKLDENGKPIFREDGKILKGKNYFEPNIKLTDEVEVEFKKHHYNVVQKWFSETMAGSTILCLKDWLKEIKQ